MCTITALKGNFPIIYENSFSWFFIYCVHYALILSLMKCFIFNHVYSTLLSAYSFKGPIRFNMHPLTGHYISLQYCRLWVDLWKDVAKTYHNIFTYLETQRLVNPDDPVSLWCLHYVFIPRLNNSLSTFIEQWNLHGLRTEKGSPSPKSLFLEVSIICSHCLHATKICPTFSFRFNYF